VWQETKTITTRSGVFRAILGQTYPINPSIVSVPELWLGVRLPPDAEMTPRQRIAGSVYSVGATEAQVSQTVGISPDNIATRRWYKIDKARGLQIDVPFAVAGYGMATTGMPNGLKEGTWSACNIDELISKGTDAASSETCLEVTALGITPKQGGVIVDSLSPTIGHNMVASVGEGIAWFGGHQFSSFSHFMGISGKCWSITVVGAKSACAQANQIVLADTDTSPSDFETITCNDCRYLAYDGTFLWASSYPTGSVVKFDLTRQYDSSGTYRYLKNAYPSPQSPTATSISVGTNPKGIEFDGSNIWVAVAGENVVKMINGADNSDISTVAVGSQPSSLLFDGTSIWVLSETDETITKIDVASKSVSGTYSVGSGPKDIGFDGSTIWISNAGDSSITLLRSSDGALIDTISLQGTPYWLQFDGQWMWVATKANPGLAISDGGNLAVSGTRWFLTRF
jgi:hypothetical protein